MGTNQLINLRTMVINAEAVAGTYAAPEAADATIRVRSPEVSLNLPVDDENAKPQNGSHAEDESIATTQTGQVSCSVRATYSGAVATEPQWWALAKACGCDVVTYTTTGLGLVRRAAKDDTTYSIAVYDTEIGASPVTTIYQFAGCVGNMVLTAENIGAPLMANFTFQGKLNDIVDGTKLAQHADTQTQLAESFLGNTFTIGGTTERLSSFSFDLGNEINPIYSQEETTGVLHYALTAARPRFSCNPLAVNQATRDWLNEFLSETTSPSSLATSNFTLKVVDGQLITPALANREQFVNWDLTFKCLQNGIPSALADTDLTLEDTFELLQGSRTA